MQQSIRAWRFRSFLSEEFPRKHTGDELCLLSVRLLENIWVTSYVLSAEGKALNEVKNFLCPGAELRIGEEIQTHNSHQQ